MRCSRPELGNEECQARDRDLLARVLRAFHVQSNHAAPCLLNACEPFGTAMNPKRVAANRFSLALRLSYQKRCVQSYLPRRGTAVKQREHSLRKLPQRVQTHVLVSTQN